MKLRSILVAAVLIRTVGAAAGQELVVFADQLFRPALKEIAPLYTTQTGFEVRLVLQPSAKLVERIRSGAAADLFFPAGEDYMGQAMEKGLVDVALKRNILLMPVEESAVEGLAPEPQYTSAAVLIHATNRLQAMAFLEFLASEPARAAFARQGFAPP